MRPGERFKKPWNKAGKRACNHATQQGERNRNKGWGIGHEYPHQCSGETARENLASCADVEQPSLQADSNSQARKHQWCRRHNHVGHALETSEGSYEQTAVSHQGEKQVNFLFWT